RSRDPDLAAESGARRAAGTRRADREGEQAMSDEDRPRHRRRRRHRRRHEEEPVEELGRIDWPRFAVMIAGWLLIAAFLLLLVLPTLPLGANRDLAWAPLLMALGVIGIGCALGLGDPRGFAVEPKERWWLLALLVCFLAFVFVGLLQLSTLAPAAGSSQFY